LANVTLVTSKRHAGRILDEVVPSADADAECIAGASCLPNEAGLVYKVLGVETEPVKGITTALGGRILTDILKNSWSDSEDPRRGVTRDVQAAG
jgi:hypothetical protein